MDENNQISIIMSVYNADEYLAQAIDSIINQTYQNWEFIICDDASTDDTNKILLEYKNKFPDKFIILKNKENRRLAFSLNRCLEHSSGTYIARMDADDISSPMRLQKQIEYLQNNKHVDLVGTAMQRFNDNNLNDRVFPREKYPSKYSMKYGTPFFHATILTYKTVYDEVSGYTVAERTNRGQDYDLWFKFFYANFNGENIMKPLYRVREDRNAVRRRTPKTRLNTLKTTKIGYKMLDFSYFDYLRKAIITFSKILVPYKFQDLYRKFQENNSNNKDKKII